ncbi:MAG: PadR family transcriptional regulator [Thermoanaerobaculia bacterium]|nr:PadR family transcriptional regulator [Thermoanaerobaculia bacterium]
MNREPNLHLPLRPADFLLLAVLQDEPLHGYGLSKAMAERSDGCIAVRPGDMYRVLDRLVEQEIVTVDESSIDERGRTTYRLTKLGRRVLRAEAQRLSDLSARVLAAATAEPREVSG